MEFFTRETWRSGKRRKLRVRKKPYGGCTEASPEFLAAAQRTKFQPGRPGYRICAATKRDGTPCRRLAMRDLQVCESHGGVRALAGRGELQPSGRSAAFRAAAVEGRSPPPPIELVRLNVYRQANQRTRARLARAWMTPAWATLVRQIQHPGI
jgi:hypothetical protein